MESLEELHVDHRMIFYSVDWIHMVTPWEHTNVLLDSMKGREFLNQMSACHFLKKNSVQWENVFRKQKSSDDYDKNVVCYDHEYIKVYWFMT
jgi:hypothetical protein